MKKFRIILIALVFSLSFSIIANSLDYTQGDINSSGAITPTDSLLALQIYTEKITTPSAQQLLSADVNSSGGVTPTDALMILQFYTEKITHFVTPIPTTSSSATPTDTPTPTPVPTPAPTLPAEVSDVNVFVDGLSGLTFANINTGASFTNRIRQILVNGVAAERLPGFDQWRIEVPAGTVAEDLLGTITVIQYDLLINTTTAKIDIFGTTYVRVTLLPGITASSVNADGNPMTYNSTASRWEIILNTLTTGASVVIDVTDDSGKIDQVTLAVTEL
jgi:hypothetical protein